MIRKLSLALALAMGTTPLAVNALGMGDIHLKSALNQNLNADIDLLSVSADELSDVRVTLAPASAYQRAGIERPFHLTKLRFRADMTADGSPVIHVSSRDPIREPFLNFLIEINWPKGKLVREYTVLLDPPVTLDRRPAPVQQPTQSRSQQRPSTSPSSVPAGAMAGMDEYGPTQKNDTLWGIAAKVRHQGTNMDQTMLALQKANPQAFINNNINNLKRGQILRIPKKNEVLELSRQQARDAYREQLSEWQSGRSTSTIRSAGATPTDTSMSDQAQPSTPTAELKIATPRPAGEGEGGAAEGRGEAEAQAQEQALVEAQEALESAKQEGDELNSRVGDLESQLADLQRLLELKNNQLAQFQAALAEQDDVTSEGVAEMASDTDEAAAEDEMVVAEAGSTDEPEADEVIVEEGTADSPIMAEDSQSDMASTEMEVVDDPAIIADEPTIIADEPTVIADEPVEVAAVEVEDAPATEEPKPVAKMPAKDEPGLIDTITGDTTLLGGAVGGLVVLLGLLWAVISRRRKGQEDFQESILVNTIDEGDSEQVDNLSQEPVSQPADETSFLSDFSPSDIDALQDETGEVDPLAEADVYIAYGRYQQAEELIRQAIDRDPERDGLKYKLFEILFAIKDADGFVKFAETSVQQDFNTKDAAAWSKVVEMGGQIAPDNEMFSGSGATAATLESDDNIVELGSDFSLDEGLDLDEISSSVDLLDAETTAELDAVELSGLHDLISDTPEEEQKSDDGLEFDLDLGLGSEIDLGEEDAADSDETLELPVAETADDDSLPEFDTDFDLDMAEEEADDLSDLDVDVSLDDLGPEDSVDGESVFAIDDPLENTEFEELDVQAEVGDEIPEPLVDADDGSEDEVENTLEQDLDLDGLNLESDSAIVGIDELVDTTDSEMLSLDDLDGEDVPATEDDGLPDMDVMDEVNTKLDLARAYVEMEDHDGAKSILNEVLGEGSDGQKQEAQRLLDELA